MQKFTNNAASVLSAPLSDSDTILSVASSASFPVISGGDYFLATLIGYDNDNNESAWEIVKVSDVTGNAMTVERAYEGTTALAWPQSTRIEVRLTADRLNRTAYIPFFTASNESQELVVLRFGD